MHAQALVSTYTASMLCSIPIELAAACLRFEFGLVKFIPAVAYRFCPTLPAAFTQPGARLLAEPCTLADILCDLVLRTIHQRRGLHHPFIARSRFSRSLSQPVLRRELKLPMGHLLKSMIHK